MRQIREVLISSIIVDGYNLIGIYHRDLEAQRDKLINLLIEYGKTKGHSIVVVFDGWKSGGGTENSSVRGGVKIIYSRLGERADSVIKRILSSDRREWVVVSSDREIANHAWAMGSIPIHSEEFLSFIEAGAGPPSCPDIPGFEKDEEDRGLNEKRKGNPKRLSKKERAMKRALGKL